MKKLTLIILLFSGFFGQAQFTLTNHETGQQINDGAIITINTNDFTTHIIATNTGNSDIYLTLEVQNIINTNGSEMQYCFGVAGGGNCFFGMGVNDVKQGGNPLAPGASTQNTDIDFTHHDGTAHDSNGNPLNFPNYPKDYVIKIYASDTNGGTQIGNAITFTYRYDPNANTVNPLEKEQIQFLVFGKSIKISTEKPLNFHIYDLTGKEVFSEQILSGSYKISLNDLRKGIYIAKFNTGNKKMYRKFIMK